MRRSVQSVKCRLRAPLAAAVLLGVVMPATGVSASFISARQQPTRALPLVASIAPASEYLVSNAIPVVSSTNIKLTLSVSAYNLGDPPGEKSVQVALATRGTSNHETYTWTFTEPATDFAIASSGNATLALAANQINPYGSLQLSFKQQSSHVETCSQGTGRVESGVLSGSLTLNTNSYRKVNGKRAPIWGVVTEKRVQFASKGRPDTLTLSQGCQPVTEPTVCSSYVTWNSPNYVLFGTTTPGARYGNITAIVNKILKVPHGSATLSGTLIDVSPTQTFANNKLTIRTGYAGEKATTGSATMTFTGALQAPITAPCKSGKVTKQQTTRSFTGAAFTWTNGPKPLTATFSLVSPVKVSNAKNVDASVTIATVK